MSGSKSRQLKRLEYSGSIRKKPTMMTVQSDETKQDLKGRRTKK